MDGRLLPIDEGVYGPRYAAGGGLGGRRRRLAEARGPATRQVTISIGTCEGLTP